MKAIIDVLGWSGSVLIILAYALTLIENRKYLDYGKYLNLLGGLLIAINCYYYNAIPSFVTNSLWSVIATLTIYKSRNKKDECKKLFKFDPSVLFWPFLRYFSLPKSSFSAAKLRFWRLN